MGGIGRIAEEGGYQNDTLPAESARFLPIKASIISQVGNGSKWECCKSLFGGIGEHRAQDYHKHQKMLQIVNNQLHQST